MKRRKAKRLKRYRVDRFGELYESPGGDLVKYEDAVLFWTKDFPKKSGIYWTRIKLGGKWQVRMVEFDLKWHSHWKRLDMEFAGPILEPVERK